MYDAECCTWHRVGSGILIAVYSDFPHGTNAGFPAGVVERSWHPSPPIMGSGQACWSPWVWHPLIPDGKGLGLGQRRLQHWRHQV